MTLRDVWGRDRNIIIGDFDCERYWERPDELRLPHLDLSSIQTIVENLDELLLYLAGPQDIVILRNQPDAAFLSYLKSLNIQLPHIFSITCKEHSGPLSKLVLQDPHLMSFLINNNNKDGLCWVLKPYGVTNHDKNLGMRIKAQVPCDPQLAADLNDKQTLRQYMEVSELSMPHGCLCESSRDIIRAGGEFFKKGGGIVLKELHNAGGAGLAKIDSEVKLWKLLDLCEPTYHKKIIVERWYDVQASYNIQFYIDNGNARFYSFSRQLINQGKIRGSFFDMRSHSGLRKIMDKHIQATAPLVQHISQSGYSGIVGIDSMICRDGEFFPAVDVNCRINLSTIFKEISSRYFSTKVSSFFYVDIRSRMKIGFLQLFDALGPLNYAPSKREGAIILNFTALNINRLKGGYSTGRVFIGVFSDSLTRVLEIGKKVETQLSKG